MAEHLIGDLPEGWRAVSLAEIGELTAGTATPATSEEGTVAVAKPKNLVRGRIAGPPDLIDEDEARRLDRYRLVEGDIVCVRTGGLGRHALMTREQHGWVCGTGLIRVRLREEVDHHYLNHYLSHPAVLDWLTRNSVRSPIPSISTTVLGTLPVALPPPEAQRAIGHALHTLSEKIEAHERIAETTTALRDTLLPLLISGTVIAPGKEG
ncbi:restriction endonuclease subunit S [Nonomuraea candida]|uniref:restriction endonuclease subunit S n=1 Tax=Nonomuraea candida TaxID=359159 RepID=UPI00069480A9|nr:restriction endonuclease subunit S [Nonomuraea candida]